MEKENKNSLQIITLEIENEIARQNILRMLLISLISLAIFIGLLIINIYSHFISKKDETSLILYSIPWILTLLLNSTVLILGLKNKNKRGALTDKESQKVHNLTTFYVWAMLALSCYISLLDLHYYNHLIIYSIYLIICSAVIIVHIRTTIVPIILCSLLLLGEMMNNSQFDTTPQFNLLLLTLLTVVTLILSFFNFTTIHDSLMQQKLLLQEKIHTNELTTQLQIAAHTDTLTGLSNRRGYSEYIKTLEKNLPLRITMLIFDIDSFKNYNDYYGHAYGDIVLTKVAECLHTICTPADRFAVRWGGEEFLVLLQNHSDEQVHEFVQLFIEAVNSYHIQHVQSPTADYLTFSIGGNSQVILDLEELDTCILRADDAQYIVKRSTKNDFVLATDGEITYITDPVKNYKQEQPFIK